MTFETKMTKIDRKRKKDLEGEIGKGQLHITKGKGDDSISKDEAKAESYKGKELAIAELMETKQKKIIILDPKVKEDLKKGVNKDFTPPEIEPKRRIITRSKTNQSLAVKEKGSLEKRKLTITPKKNIPKRPRR